MIIELKPLSTSEIEAKLLYVCQFRRMAIDAEQRHAKTGDKRLRKFWHEVARRMSVEREVLAEVLGLLSGDPADEHCFDRLQAWEQARLFVDGAVSECCAFKGSRPEAERIADGLQVTAEMFRDTPAVKAAFREWNDRMAYVDGHGNYHVKIAHDCSSGPIAPWNKEVKQAFATVEEFHDAARAFEGSRGR